MFPELIWEISDDVDHWFARFWHFKFSHSKFWVKLHTTIWYIDKYTIIVNRDLVLFYLCRCNIWYFSHIILQFISVSPVNEEQVK